MPSNLKTARAVSVYKERQRRNRQKGRKCWYVQGKVHILRGAPTSASKVIDGATGIINGGTVEEGRAGSTLGDLDQSFLKYGEVLGTAHCEFRGDLVFGSTVSTGPLRAEWPHAGSGQGPQPFVARFPSGAIRGITASLQDGEIEFAHPSEMLDPDQDPVPGHDFKFQVFQLAPHPSDLGAKGRLDAKIVRESALASIG